MIAALFSYSHARGLVLSLVAFLAILAVVPLALAEAPAAPLHGLAPLPNDQHPYPNRSGRTAASQPRLRMIPFWRCLMSLRPARRES